MDELTRNVLLIKLVESMRQKGSWAGETHIQKASFLLQESFLVPTKYDFVIYKYGPFSFGLRKLVGEMVGDELLEYVARPPYGPSLRVTETGEELVKIFKSGELENYFTKIEEIADKLRDKGVYDLERIATTVFIVRENSGFSDQEISARVNEIKPHISLELAKATLEEVRSLDLV